MVFLKRKISSRLFVTAMFILVLLLLSLSIVVLGGCAADNLVFSSGQIDARKSLFDARACGVRQNYVRELTVTSAILFPHYQIPLSLHSESSDFDGRRAFLERQKASAEYRYSDAIYGCHSKFFVNACLDRAKNKHRKVLSWIRSQRLALEADLRRARAQARDARFNDQNKP
ncbi:hypothetical protein [Candidatus Pandoraea novymonadis]|uniref:Lysozyme inhibitor LprI N-terminal domain-containing protein n=1 Tax=Candidatus Pandoraea novymonadis TaxID=1808959 RepID=A0ABX5FEP5_9BURK|nr:hypothetical protein [Candidatus Pandoraea novymonadis]PSB92179.1 hypothetical protein BZL35_00413 [Candidatus Pandoraea novymonadis]